MDPGLKEAWIELSKLRTVALVSTTAAVVAVAFSPVNETIVGFTPAFMPAFLGAIFLIELLTAYLL